MRERKIKRERERNFGGREGEKEGEEEKSYRGERRIGKEFSSSSPLRAHMHSCMREVRREKGE